MRFGLLFFLRYEAQTRGDLEKIKMSRGLPEPERKVRVWCRSVKVRIVAWTWLGLVWAESYLEGDPLYS